MIEDEIYEAMETQPEGFKIDSDSLASWAVKIIKKEQEETERLMKIADDQIAELQERKQKIQEQYEHKTGYMKAMLYQYFMSVPHKDTKTQETYKLFDGTLYYKKPSLKMVPDKEKLLAYCKANNMPEFVKVKEDVDWAAYKKECEIVDGQVVNVQTGDMLPEDMIQIEEDPGKFDVK